MFYTKITWRAQGYFYLKGTLTEQEKERGESSICWFRSKMTVTVGAGSARNQEPGAAFKHLGHLLLLSQVCRMLSTLNFNKLQ